MTKRIFRSVCLAAFGVLLASLALIMGVLYNYFSDVQQKQLRVQTELAAQGVSQQGMAYFVACLPMALGGLTEGVRLIELAAAYQIFGNGGVLSFSFGGFGFFSRFFRSRRPRKKSRSAPAHSSSSNPPTTAGW